MSQHDYNIANQGFSSFRSDLNNALSAIQTTNSGTSRPTGAVAGQLWLDTTTATSPTLKYYDGADDISLATIDHTANTVNWLDSTVSITGLSTTATGTVLTLSDSANTTTVNLIIDNQKEVRFRETTANGTNYIGLKAPASVSADLTFTLPSADGTAGQVLQTNGSGVLSFATVGGLAWQSVQTTGFTAVSSRGYPCNTTSSAFTVTLPATPSVGDTIILVDYAGTFATNNITLNRNSNKIEGGTTNKLLTTNREAVTLTYVDSTQGWVSSSGANEGTKSVDPLIYTVDFLVIAGGGGGGGYAHGGGGGAGGYRNSYSTETSGGGGSSETSLILSSGTVYSITVGAGGTGATGSAGAVGLKGTNGSNSVLSGSDITTITSLGGGGGGSYNFPPSTASFYGADGGSGGGDGSVPSNYRNPGSSGTANQGYGGGGTSTYAPNPYFGGGGGGAGAVGAGGSSLGNADGGAGLASSITGSSVTRGGGGGGALGGGSGHSGLGGSGGGGNHGVTTGSNGTANTGGGAGGGGQSPCTGGNGGSGVVILRMPTASYSGTTTGSPTVSTSGSDTILVYNASGTYTG
jgi:hypothetical protein